MVGDKISPNLSEQITVHKSACLIHLDADSKDDRNVHVQQQDAELQDQVLNNFLRYGTDRRLTYTGCNEQVDGHRRCDHTDRSIYNNDKTKCDRAYTKCSSDRQQDRCYQKDDGLCLKEASQEQKQQVHYEQDDKLIGED